MQKIKQSSATRHILFLMVDSTDHVTGKTGLTPTVTISKNGAAFASPAGAVTEVSSGWYKLAANATDSNTLGILALHATGTAADPTDFIAADIVAHDPDDTVRLGLTALPNAAANAAGGLPISVAGGLDLDAKVGALTFTVANKVDANTTHAAGTAWGSGAITAASIAADAITAAKVADDVSTEFRTKAMALTTGSGVVGSGSTTANLVASSVAVGATTSLSADAWKGRVIIFNSDTTTAALRGQAGVIQSHTSGSTPTFTMLTAAWTTAPLSSDSFTVV